ncbi:hypothetical protein Tco_0590214 [Tanacetum coccineum]
MIKEHDQQTKMKATQRKLAYVDSNKEAPTGSLTRGFSDRLSLESSGTSDTRKQTRSASKSRRTPSKNEEPTYLKRSRRLENRSINQKKRQLEGKVPQNPRKRSERQETSSDSEREEGSEDTCEDLNSRGAARNRFDDLDPKSVNSFEELSQKFLKEFSQQKRYAKDPTEVHGIKRRQIEGLQTFMDRFKSKSSHIKGVPPVLCISDSMHGHGHPELAKKLNDKIPKTLDEMFERVRAFIRGEVVVGETVQRGWEIGKDAKGNTIVHPPVSLDEHVAVQRENKVRTLLLQALPEDHMLYFSSFYEMQRDIWLAVKARFRRSNQLNQVQARPDNDDINLKFLRALPSSWSQVALALKTRGGLDSMSFDDLYNKLRSLELDVRIGHSYGVKAAAAPTHSAFIGAASSGSKLTYSDQQSIVPSVYQTSGRSDNIMECVLHSFVAENEPDQDMIYEDFDQVDQLEMEELDLKWQMAMLSLEENKTGEVEEVLGLMAGFMLIMVAYQNAVKTLESQKDWYHKTQIALEEKIRILSANLENTTNTLSYTEKLHDQAQKEKKEWEVKFEATLARFEKWKESSKNLKKLINSSMSTRTKIGLGFKEYFGKDEVFDLSTPSVMYPEPVEEVKPLYSWFVKAGEMHAVPPSITGTYMPTPYKSDIEETQVSYGSKSDNKTSETISESNDFVSCDNSDKSSDSKTYASCDSSLKTKTKDFPPAVDIKTLPESDVEDPNSTAGSPSFSCSENVKSPRIICNKSGMNNRNVCKNNSVRVKKCFVCGSKLHLIKDCDFYNCVDSVPCKSKAASVPAGSRNSSASVTAGGSDPAASRNRPAVNSAGRPNPTRRVGRVAHLATAQSNPACWSKRSAPVSAGRPVSADWRNPAARPYFRPSSVYFNNMYWPEFYDPMHMNEGQWGTAGDPSTDNDIGIVDSGCSRSMTGNKEKLDDFVQVKGGIVKFGGGDGRISGKGTIRTSKLDFENVYYVEELQHFNLFSCKKQTIVATSSTEAEYVAAASCCAQVLWIQNHSPCSCNKEWLVQEGTAFGKDFIKSVDGCQVTQN